MVFRQAVINDHFQTQIGENGMPEYTDLGVGSNVLALSQMVRGGDPSALVRQIIVDGTSQELADLVVLIFATRNTRGGKGEKKIAYDMFLDLYKEYPKTALDLLELFAHYGYWKDYFKLIEEVDARPFTMAAKSHFRRVVVGIVSEQLKKDVQTLEEWKENDKKGELKISLLAKWLPREGSSFDKSTGIVNELASALFPVVSFETSEWKSKTKKLYRKTLVELTSTLDLPEVLLAAQREEEIKFGKLASRATMRLRKVFLNEDKHGNARSENPKRIKLAEDFIEYTIEKGLKGAQLMPHEIVHKIMTSHVSKHEEMVLDAQWKALVASVKESIDTNIAEGAEPTRLVPLSDVSGSMNGVPMEVSIALGLVLSEITHPAFRGLVMTFESQPRWHEVELGASIVEKVCSLQRAPWGGSTDFVKVYRLVLEVAEKNGLKKEEIPALIVFSDMQFNYAHQGNSKIMHDVLKSMFAETAKRLGWEDATPMPMVYWNLRNTGGHPVDKDTEGAVLLSGFSPSLLKLVMDGKALEDEEIEVVQTDGTVIKEKIRVTPEEILRKMLDSPLYDRVREVLHRSTEGKLREFEIVEAEKKEDDFEMV